MKTVVQEAPVLMDVVSRVMVGEIFFRPVYTWTGKRKRLRTLCAFN